MDEFFISGIGLYVIGDEMIKIKKNDFVFIPVGVTNKVIVLSKGDSIEMVYFGIAEK